LSEERTEEEELAAAVSELVRKMNSRQYLHKVTGIKYM
jgi:hypothetical protein